MPDHVHFLWTGCAVTSHQLKAVAALRRTTAPLLGAHRWQRQAYDHVLTSDERAMSAFQLVSYYILENPVRTSLAEEWASYPYSGSLEPGYADLSVRRGDFWEVFWKVYNGRVSETAP
jgi:hypothetical protein